MSTHLPQISGGHDMVTMAVSPMSIAPARSLGWQHRLRLAHFGRWLMERFHAINIAPERREVKP